MIFINYALIAFIFVSLVLMVWLWQRLSNATSKLDTEIEALRKWQKEHLPLEKWANFLERSIGSLTVGTVLIDPQLNIMYINPAAEQILGVNLPQIKGKAYQTNLGLVREDGKSLAEEKDPLLHVFQTRQPMEKQNYKVQNGSVDRSLDVTWLPIVNLQN